MKKQWIIFFMSAMIFTSCKSGKFPQEKYDQAYEQMINENYSEAKESFRKLTESNSAFPEIWYGYGCCLMETENYSESVKAFTKVTELYENSVMYDDKEGLKYDAMTSIGEVFLLQKETEKAKIQFEKCLTEQNNREMINAIAATYIRLGFIDEAEAFFAEKGIDIWMM